MNSHQPESKNGTQYHKSKYKPPCAGRGCKNVQTDLFDIAIKIKSGWLCPSCKKSLEEDGFVFYGSQFCLGVGDGKLVKVPTEEDGSITTDGKEEKNLNVQ